MQLDLSYILAVTVIIAVLAAAAFFRLVRPSFGRSPQSQARSVDRADDGLSFVQFEVSEIPAIRHLLGTETATALLAALARKVSKLGHPHNPPEIGRSAITVSFAASEPAVLAEQIGAVTATLGETTKAAGATFNCTVRATILDAGGEGDKASLPTSNGEKRPENAADSPAGRLDLLQNLHAGMANGEVALAYQPKLDLRANAIHSAEALLRWNRPDGQVNTGDLVALCEQTGTIKELTRWTIARAIADNERFVAAGFPLLVFVNVSGSLLADSDFADEFLQSVSQTKAQIGIEITETAVIADPDIAITNLNRFAKAGIAIAIDDFGAGLSSLEYLQRLPASELKIDRTFIAELGSSHRNPLIIRATIDLAHALDMRVTAEGVDDQLSMALLKIMGCDMAQGYLISRPLEPHKINEFLLRFKAGEGDESLPNQPLRRPLGKPSS